MSETSAKPPLPPADKLPEDPRVRFAAERTLLAWIRTGLALMGFGFVVARFGLFLRELAAMSHRPDHPPEAQHSTHSTHISMVLGTTLVVLGVVMTLLAAWQHHHEMKRIQRREAFVPPRLSPGLVLAVLMAFLGVGMVCYLLLVNH